MAEARPGQTLSRVLFRAGLPIKLYCQGRGICGRCLVEIKSGRLLEETEAERKLRLGRRFPPGFRLACQLRLHQSLTVRIPDDLLLQPEIKNLAGMFPGSDRPALRDFNPLVKKYVLRLSREDLSAEERLVSAIKSGLGLKQLVLSPAAEQKPKNVGASRRQSTAVIYDDRLLLDLEAGRSDDRILGLALDLGTTTVSARLLDLVKGKTLTSASVANLQAAFGADLISRIAFSVEKPGNLKKLQQAALKSIAQLTASLAREAGVKPKWIYAVCLAGNAVMNHILLNQPVDSLGRAPFRPAFLCHDPVPASEVGLKLNPQAMVFISPNLGGFVGGDISAGLVYTGLPDKPGNYLYVDLGTNGEIALKKGKKILVASTAAGPAFEGSGISCGQPALPGAIEYVKWSGGSFEYRTIGRKKPTGLCGSGLLGVLAESLRAGWLLPSGRITAGRSEVPVAPGLALSQIDIRKLQLALAALKSGMRLLLGTAGLDWTELDGLYLAGVFGSSIDPGQCIAAGLLPPLPRRKIIFAGNASLAGAELLLLSGQARKSAARLPLKVQHISLAGQENFQGEFLKALSLGRRYWRANDV
ncbi:MAG: Methyltransferase corrinoid activation protein [Candidatus Saccharicenans subterraneus]|uniref:Methyltransferase corrinoid activation protein n=1 Tax=Candidatus Saccharicenans subterraneus TaxID=2508984 RepID=A0A3E2BNB5_9BACT|nr:MAG: Methyltransferase corrinoid activation protein [Candidatus Saccharicenans subterraneum]